MNRASFAISNLITKIVFPLYTCISFNHFFWQNEIRFAILGGSTSKIFDRSIQLSDLDISIFINFISQLWISFSHGLHHVRDFRRPIARPAFLLRNFSIALKNFLRIEFLNDVSMLWVMPKQQLTDILHIVLTLPHFVQLPLLVHFNFHLQFLNLTLALSGLLKQLLLLIWDYFFLFLRIKRMEVILLDALLRIRR